MGGEWFFLVAMALGLVLIIAFYPNDDDER